MAQKHMYPSGAITATCTAAGESRAAERSIAENGETSTPSVACVVHMNVSSTPSRR